jgi:hypothetical protein
MDRCFDLGKNEARRMKKNDLVMFKIWPFFLFFAAVLPVYADQDLDKAKTIRCSYPSGRVGIVSLTQDQWKTTEVKESYDVIFDNISYDEGAARFIVNEGSSDVRVIKSDVGVTFIQASTANVIIPGFSGYSTNIVITPTRLRNGYPSVFSRVLYLPLGLGVGSNVEGTLGSQYFGFCKVASFR